MTGPARPFADHGILWQESKLPKQPECSDHRESPALPVLGYLEKIYRQYRHSPPSHAVPIVLFTSLKDWRCECSVDQLLAPSQHRSPSLWQLAVSPTTAASYEMLQAASSRQYRVSSHLLQRLPQRPQPGQQAVLDLLRQPQLHVDSRLEPGGSKLQN